MPDDRTLSTKRDSAIKEFEEIVMLEAAQQVWCSGANTAYASIKNILKDNKEAIEALDREFHEKISVVCK